MNEAINPTWTSDCGTVKLWLGDCLEVMRGWPDDAVDAVVTDPPYKTAYQSIGSGVPVSGRYSFRRLAAPLQGYSEVFNPLPLQRWRCLLFGADAYCHLLPEGGVFHVWDKTDRGGPDDSFSDVEIIWSSWRCKRQMIRYLWKGVCQQGEKGRKKFHPSQKPEAVMVRCVEMVSGTIGDPFMGSGTTGVAAIRLGRQFWGVEIDEHYFEVAKRRIQDELDKQDFLEPDRKKRQLELIDAEAS